MDWVAYANLTVWALVIVMVTFMEPILQALGA
jgi:hypothetical protein